MSPSNRHLNPMLPPGATEVQAFPPKTVRFGFEGDVNDDPKVTPTEHAQLT